MQRALKLRLAVFLVFPVAGFSPAGAQTSQTSSFSESHARTEIEDLIQKSGATVSIAFRSLDGANELFLNADARYDDPNALRIPVLITAYAAADSHSISLSDPGRTRGNSGLPAPTIGELCETMIVQNSDPATNLLLERFTLAAIRGQIQSLGADGMEIGGAFPNKEKNYTSLRAVLVLLWKLATERVGSPDASKAMLALLGHSMLHQVPPVAPVVAPPSQPAPAAGTPSALHDAVIIYGAHSFVLVIQVQGLKDTSRSAELIAKISSALERAM
jgi:hypothetical protein